MIKIDTAAATQFEQSSLTRRESLNFTATTIRSRLASTGLSTRVAELLSDLAGHVETTGTDFGDAARRANSADDQGAAACGANFGALSITALNPFLPTHVTPQEKEEAERIANDLKNDPTDPKKQQAAIDFMKANMDNPELMKEFIETVGPEALLDIPAALAYAFDAKGYNNPMNYQGYEAIEADRKKMMEAQDALMSLLGQAMATAADKGGLDPNFPNKLADLAIGDQRPLLYGEVDTKPWALSQLLKHGDYPEGFLLTIANKLDAYERSDKGHKNMWLNRLGTDPSKFVLGTDRDWGYYDPMVGLFQAMGRTPDAALNFLYGSNADPKRAEYYIKNRKWAHDDYNAIGEFLDGAATAHRGPLTASTTPQERRMMELSSKAASDAVRFLPARKDPIGAGGADSIGHLLANYIAEIDFVTGDTGKTPENWEDLQQKMYMGLPPVANMNFADVQKLLSQVLTHDSAVEQITAATNALAQARISAAAGSKKNVDDAIKSAMIQNGRLAGFIVGAAGYGNEKKAEEMEARQKAMMDLLASGLTSVPLPGGALVGFVTGQAVQKGKDWVLGQLGDSVDAAKGANYDFRRATQMGMKMMAGIELGKAGQLKEQIGDDEKPYPWFVNGEFDPTIAAEHPVEFLAYLESANSGWADPLSEIDDKIDNGVTMGRNGR